MSTTQSESENEDTRITLSIPMNEYSGNKFVILYVFSTILVLLPIIGIDIYMFVTNLGCLNIPIKELALFNLYHWMITYVIIGGMYFLLNIFICFQMIKKRYNKLYPWTRGVAAVVFLGWTIVGGFVTWYYRNTNGYCEKTMMYMYLHILSNMIFELLEVHSITRIRQ